MNFAKFATAAAALAAAPALSAQVSVGGTAYGPEGGEVGTIVSVDGEDIVVDTGKHKVPMTGDNYYMKDGKVTLPFTKDLLNSFVDKQIADAAAEEAKATAALDAALVAEAAVMTADHKPFGKVASINGDNVVIERSGDSATRVTLTRDFFNYQDGHGLMATLTLAEIDAAMAAAGKQ